MADQRFEPAAAPSDALSALRVVSRLRGAELSYHLATTAAELLDAPVALLVRFDRRGGGLLSIDACAERCGAQLPDLAAAVRERFADLVRERHPWHGPSFTDPERGPWPGLPHGRHGFLAVPLRLGSAPYASLCVLRPEDAPLTGQDEALLLELATVAGGALEDSVALEEAQRRNAALRHTVRNLKASLNVVRAVSAESELDRLFALIVQQALDLVPAECMAVLLVRDHGLELVARAGVQEDLDCAAIDKAAFVAPMRFRGESLGALACFTAPGAPAVSVDDEALLSSFAHSAATAVATARTVAESRLRRTLEAAEREREHWARELHDDTLQGLVGLRLLLERAAAANDVKKAVALATATDRVAEQVEHVRGLITRLRPMALRELGLVPALRSLVQRVEEESGLPVELEVDVREWHDEKPVRLETEIETVVYRVAQEALANAVKHAKSSQLMLVLFERGSDLVLTVRDDGTGFDLDAPTDGFGLMGMRERAALADADFELRSSPIEGTMVRLTLPARRRGSDQSARRSPRAAEARG